MSLRVECSATLWENRTQRISIEFIQEIGKLPTFFFYMLYTYLKRNHKTQYKVIQVFLAKRQLRFGDWLLSRFLMICNQTIKKERGEKQKGTRLISFYNDIREANFEPNVTYYSWLLWTVIIAAIACFHYQGFSSNQSISAPLKSAWKTREQSEEDKF